jgi:hypothetical protein
MGREWPHHVPSCRWSSVVIYSCTFKIGCQQCHLHGLFASLCQVGSELINALNMLGRLSQNWHGLPDAGHMASIWQANSSGKNSFQSWMCEKMGKGRSEMIWKLADVPTFFSVILLRRQRHRWPPTVATADAFQPDKLPELLSEELHRPYRHLGTWLAPGDSLKPCSLREMVASEKRSSDFDFGKNRQRFQCVLYTVHDVSYSQLCISFQIASVTCRRGAAAVVERSTQPICRQTGQGAMM